MQTLKWVIVILPAALAVFVGGMAAAWRRATVRLAKDLLGSANPRTLHLVTPPFVAARHRFSTALLFATTILAWILLGWKVAIGCFLATYALMELSGFLPPRPSHPYYVHQIISDLNARIRIAEQFGDKKDADHLRSHLGVFEGALPSRRNQHIANEQFWRHECAHPPDESFSAIYERLGDTEREAVAAKSEALKPICESVLTHSGPERTGCERRRYFVLLKTNYPAEMRGDFAASAGKDRETVITLLAGGLAFETLLKAAGAAPVLSQVFSTGEGSPLAS